VDASPMASGPMASPVTASSRISPDESAASTPSRTRSSKSSSAGTTVRRVTVGEGDSFSTLASRYDVSEARIAALNPGVDSSDLTIGQSLRVK
jgi:LysM repeat protein